MQRLRLRVDPYAHDPGRWGHSFANLAELFVPCLEAAGARSIVEIGAYAGDLTGLLLEWAEGRDARVCAIDPMPQRGLVELAEQRAELTLVRQTSLEALAQIAPPDAVIVDGDHNYYTVSEELRLIAERTPDDDLPLILLHDVAWPHARRDAYYTPELIPEEARQPLVEGGGLFPGDPGIRPGALPYKWVAAREGGPRNGVLTAAEDFVAARPGLRLAVVPAFFGLGAMWHEAAPWSGELAALLDPWDRNSLVERLEQNRVYQLAATHVEMMRLNLQRERNARKDEFLRRLLQSRSFALAASVTALWHRGRRSFPRAELERALER